MCVRASVCVYVHRQPSGRGIEGMSRCNGEYLYLVKESERHHHAVLRFIVWLQDKRSLSAEKGQGTVESHKHTVVRPFAAAIISV